MVVGQRRGRFCETPTYEAVGDRIHVARMAPNVLELSGERSEAGGNTVKSYARPLPLACNHDGFPWENPRAETRKPNACSWKARPRPNVSENVSECGPSQILKFSEPESVISVLRQGRGPRESSPYRRRRTGRPVLRSRPRRLRDLPSRAASSPSRVSSSLWRHPTD